MKRCNLKKCTKKKCSKIYQTLSTTHQFRRVFICNLTWNFHLHFTFLYMLSIWRKRAFKCTYWIWNLAWRFHLLLTFFACCQSEEIKCVHETTQIPAFTRYDRTVLKIASRFACWEEAPRICFNQQNAPTHKCCQQEWVRIHVRQLKGFLL